VGFIRRAAMLTAAAIAVLMKRLHENRKSEIQKICIGIDGSLYRFHPRFNMVIQRHLKILAPVLLNYELRISADGRKIILDNNFIDLVLFRFWNWCSYMCYNSE
jgi:hexokinase